MRLGIISDIHADITALNAALALLVAKGADKIVCLGDVVEKGPDDDACAATLHRWLIPCVRGNHDQIALDNQHRNFYQPELYKLPPSTLAYLKTLPLTRSYWWEGQRLLLCHGSPDNAWEYLRPDICPPKRFKTIAQANDADVILCGHTHDPLDVCYKGVRFLNPGSVSGQHTRGSRTCALLHLPSLKFEVLDIPGQ